MPRVTALRPRDRNRVAVELDGEPWRELPGDAVVRAGVLEGLELDRERLRLLRRELRRSEALAVASRILRRRDASRRELDDRLARADVPPAARADALALLAETGLVDDDRLAAATADALARRGFGDAAVAFRLERLGVPEDVARQACDLLQPEAARAARIAETRGRSRKTAAYLARRGFTADSIEDALGTSLADPTVEGYDDGSSSDIFPA
jgi:regulatory protein